MLPFLADCLPQNNITKWETESCWQWREVKDKLREAQWHQPDPGNSPANSVCPRLCLVTVTCYLSGVCARSKASCQLSVGLLHPLPVPSRPWSHIAQGFVIGLPPSQGNIVILTIVDCFSKAVHFVALPKLPSTLETVNLPFSVSMSCLPWVEYAHNSLSSAATGMTPFDSS